MRMTMPTAPIAYSGSGWSSGIAAQLNLPSMSASRLPRRWTPGCAGWPSGTRHGLLDNTVEQLGLHRTIGFRRHRLARFCQFGIGGKIECRSRASDLSDPAVEIAGRHCLGDEPHFGKAVAAEHCRKPGEFAGRVREQVQVGGHPSHRVDLAAELRHEKGIHHCRRSQTKTDRRRRRDDQLIDRRNTLMGIDEQPFPIECHNLDPERVDIRWDWRPRVELMGTDPDYPAQQDYNQRRDRPENELGTPLIALIRAAAGLRV